MRRSRSRLAFLAARGLAVGASLAVAALAQRVPNDVRLDTDPPGAAGSWSQQIATSGSAVYVTWWEGRNGDDIYFNHSLDGGVTWLANDVRLDSKPAGVGRSVNPQIAASGSSVYVTWGDTRNGRSDIYFNRSLDNGTTWLVSDLRLDTDPPGVSHSRNPRIAAVGSSVYVAWDEERASEGQKEIYFNRSPDGGTTWLASDVRLNTLPPGGQARFPRIAAEGSSVYVTWEDNRRNPQNNLAFYDIWFDRSLDGGTTWLASDMRLNTVLAGSITPRIATSGPSVYVTWVDLRNGGPGTTYFNRSLDRGTTWLEQDVQVNKTKPVAARASGAPLSASGSFVYVTWSDDRYGLNNVFFNRSLDGGSTWLEQDVQVSTYPPYAATEASSITSSGSSVYVMWMDYRNGTYGGSNPTNDVYFNQSVDGGTTWQASDVRVNTDRPGAATSYAPNMALSGTSVCVSWEDLRNGSSDIYFNYLDIRTAAVLTYGTSSPGCSGPLSIGPAVDWVPRVGNAGFAVSCSNAPPGSSLGLLVLSPALSVPPLQILGIGIWVDLVPPVAVLPASANGAGVARVPLPIPALPALVGQSVFGQFLWVTESTHPPCPPLGWSASNALKLTIQP